MSENLRLPQNINHLLMEIGEKSVTFRLFLLTRKLKKINDEKNLNKYNSSYWEVYPNLAESGCDVQLINHNNKGCNRLKIEVKTRQRLSTIHNGVKNRSFSFSVTENEFKNMDFLICYWFEKNSYFIIPKQIKEKSQHVLKETSSNGEKKYYIKIPIRRDNTPNISDELKKYQDDKGWGLLENHLVDYNGKGECNV
jgi:hypothetical protein